MDIGIVPKSLLFISRVCKVWSTPAKALSWRLVNLFPSRPRYRNDVKLLNQPSGISESPLSARDNPFKCLRSPTANDFNPSRNDIELRTNRDNWLPSNVCAAILAMGLLSNDRISMLFKYPNSQSPSALILFPLRLRERRFLKRRNDEDGTFPNEL